ncbi:MAG: hypothetical protein K2N38_14340, partial [Oscillospiraceae bacterium]|nr:hypothetical protein [Oscillospiraceae bacterium]
AMGELFGVTLDELVRGGESYKVVGDGPEQKVIVVKKSRFVNGEFRSEKKVMGKPLVHINFKGKANGFLAIGLMARGVFAIGLLSMGVVTIGLLSLGVLVVGAVAALGIAVNASIAAGIFAFGGVAIGVFAFGGVAMGWLTYGGASIGVYAIGGYAHGQLAIGGYAEGIIAFGDEMSGEIELPYPITADEFRAAVESRLPNTPKFIVDLFSWFASNMSAK